MRYYNKEVADEKAPFTCCCSSIVSQFRTALRHQ